MASTKDQQYHDIPLVINGKTKIVKGATKLTTCDDVISKLSQNEDKLAVFVKTNGTEKELSGQTKLLKVWRSHSSSKKTLLVVKQSENKKTNRMSLSVLTNSHSRNSLEPVSKDKVKQLSDLAFFVRYQKSKLQRLMNAKDSSERKNMQKVKSTSSMDSMDAFLAKADHQKLGQFLDFCSSVTTRHLSGNLKVKQPTPTNPRPAKLDTAAIKDGLKIMKRGIKRTLTSKLSFVSKTTSVSTLKSTDTGYQSQTSDVSSQTATSPKSCATLVSSDKLHSSPMTRKPKRKREAEDTLDVTLTKAPRFDEVEGKFTLMERFMNDTTICEANEKRQRRNDCRMESTNICTSAPVLFCSQDEICRLTWNKYCDSDSDSSYDDSVATNLDEAFVENNDDVDSFNDLPGSTTRKLRRESGLSDLNKFEICAKPFEETFYDEEFKSTGFDYSFNCSFPEFSDSQDFIVDYSCSETESDLSISFEETVIDNDFYNLMKSRKTLSVNGKSRYIARESQSEVGSDEGLGSIASDSLSDDQGIFI